MKKFTQICLIIAAVFGIVGVAVLGCAAAMGATRAEVQKELSGYSLWNRVQYELEESLDNLWEDDYVDYEDYSHSHSDMEETARHQYEEADSLKVDVKKGAVYLEESDDGNLYVEVYSSLGDEEFQVESHGSTVTVSSESKDPDSEVWILLPNGKTMKDIEIKGGGSYVFLEEVKTEEMNVSLGAGVLETDGAVQAQKSSWTVGAGTMSVEMDGKEEDYNYTVSCGAGTVDLENESYSGLGTSKKITNEGAKYHVDVECGVGVIEFIFEN